MAEKSLFWFTDGFDGATGDGSAPYTQDEFSDRNRFTLGEGVIASSGVISVGASLAVSGTASPLSVGDGRAQVRGFHYHSDVIENIAVATPVVNTTGGRVVLRADYTTATVRRMLKMSADGVAAIPALTQIANDIWEISLATFTITTGGVIEVTDDRTVAITQLARPDFSTLNRDAQNRFQIANGGVSTAKLADGAVTAAKIANRTRTFFVPAVVGQNLTDSIALERERAGIFMLDLKSSVSYSSFVVPNDFVSNLTVTSIGSPLNTSGNVFGRTNCYYGSVGQAFDTNTAISGTSTVTFVAAQRDGFAALPLASAAVGHIVAVEFQRDGDEGTDTLGGTFRLEGWLVSYTADS